MLAAAFALLGCEAAPPFSAQSLPEVAPTVSPRAEGPERSIESFQLEQYYLRLQRDLLVQGLLRTDGGTFDAAYTAEDLAENFIRIALYDEYRASGDFMLPEETESNLRRWERPVRLRVLFGDTVPEAQRQEDRVRIENYTNRLARVTGLPMSITKGANANYHVLVVNEDDRLGLRPALQKMVPGISEAGLRAIINMPRTQLCIVVSFASDRTDGPFTDAIAVIRGEHPDLFRLSCIHEEIAQGLGLANDSDAARPSIFNDDEEFALLTVHDEQLLRILYDKRLKTGMDITQALPIVTQIANELFAGRRPQGTN
ncbi:MAG: DUF2927 domain-containing protein [Pseudomonadota bacterium]